MALGGVRLPRKHDADWRRWDWATVPMTRCGCCQEVTAGGDRAGADLRTPGALGDSRPASWMRTTDRCCRCCCAGTTVAVVV